MHENSADMLAETYVTNGKKKKRKVLRSNAWTNELQITCQHVRSKIEKVDPETSLFVSLSMFSKKNILGDDEDIHSFAIPSTCVYTEFQRRPQHVLFGHIDISVNDLHV